MMLIRHGWKGDAYVQVTLSNTRDGFKFDEFGCSISVKRIITQAGGGRFKLIGEDKKVSDANLAIPTSVSSAFRVGDLS